MTKSTRSKATRTPRRNLGAELKEGLAALKDQRHGKRTLRTHAVTYRPAPDVAPDELVRMRENMNLSRALFAVYLRTSVRTLESWALTGQTSGDTRIFITPGFNFKLVDLLVTNFHLPKSSLMMLVSAFAGFDHIMALYRHAIAQQYRFFSYGDAMLLTRTRHDHAAI